MTTDAERAAILAEWVDRVAAWRKNPTPGLRAGVSPVAPQQHNSYGARHSQIVWNPRVESVPGNNE